MVKELASILKTRLYGVPFVDLYGGLVQRVEYKDTDVNGNPATKRMPVATDFYPAEACTGKELSFVPDSNKRGIAYFEDGGAVFIERTSGLLHFRASLTLVVWTNKANWAGDSYAEVSARCIASIIGRIQNTNPINYELFKRVQVSPGKVLPMDSSIFSRYTYDESTTQYLRPPFEFFAIALTVDFWISPSCIDELTLNDKVCY
jgi:hypothetical protein